MPVTRLKETLDRDHIKYVLISHSPAFTSQEVAASAHVSGKEMAKTVIVRAGDHLIMAVLPASRQIDFDRLSRELQVDIALASEEEFKGLCPDCELGAMPPFGLFYGIDVLIDKRLEEVEEICFNAGTHRELLRMSLADFKKIIQPKVMAFST